MPYGIARNDNNEWMAFNREYLPLGFNDMDLKANIHKDFNHLPVFTAYKSLTDKKLFELVGDEYYIRRDEQNKIKMVLFYDDGTNPSKTTDKKLWERYFNILKKIEKFERKS